MASLLAFDPLTLRPETLEQLEPYVSLAELTPEALRGGGSLAAALLCRWYRAIFGCASQAESRAALLRVKEVSHGLQLRSLWDNPHCSCKPRRVFGRAAGRALCRRRPLGSHRQGLGRRAL